MTPRWSWQSYEIIIVGSFVAPIWMLKTSTYFNFSVIVIIFLKMYIFRLNSHRIKAVVRSRIKQGCIWIYTYYILLSYFILYGISQSASIGKVSRLSLIPYHPLGSMKCGTGARGTSLLVLQPIGYYIQKGSTMSELERWVLEHTFFSGPLWLGTPLGCFRQYTASSSLEPGIIADYVTQWQD